MSKETHKYYEESRRKYMNVYAYLCEEMVQTDVSKDKNYQRAFITFYRFRRSKRFLKIYFDYLEANKTNFLLDLEDVCLYLYAKTKKFEDCLSTYIINLIKPDSLIFTTQFKSKNLEHFNFNYIENDIEEKIIKLKQNYYELGQLTNHLYIERERYIQRLFPQYCNNLDVIKMASCYYLFKNKNDITTCSNGLYKTIRINKKLIYGSIKIVKKCKIIPTKYFQDFICLENVQMGNRVKIISSYAFDQCTQLEKVKMNRSIKSIEKYTFKDCKKLKDIYYSGLKNEFLKITSPDFSNNPNITIHCKDGELISKDIIKYIY